MMAQPAALHCPSEMELVEKADSTSRGPQPKERDETKLSLPKLGKICWQVVGVVSGVFLLIFSVVYFFRTLSNLSKYL